MPRPRTFPNIAEITVIRSKKPPCTVETSSSFTTPRCQTAKIENPASEWRLLFQIVDHRHLALPPAPRIIILDKIGHEAHYVGSTGRTRVENGASNWRSVHFKRRYRIFISQRVRTHYRPFDRFVILTNPGTQIVRCVFVVRMRGQQ